MSLHPHDKPPIPSETARVAHAAFPKGTLCLRLADTLGALYHDQQFTDLFPRRGQPAASPARLALVSVLQFVEGLSDRQAADAVRSRIDWKYALALDLTDPGFDRTVLSEFRARLIAGRAEAHLLDTLLEHLRGHGWLKARGRQRTDSTHVVAAVRVLNRLERVGETLRAALNSLAVVAPEWLGAWVPAEWFERYGDRVENYALPKAETDRHVLAETIGADGRMLLERIHAAGPLAWLDQVPAVGVLRRVWADQYVEAEDHRLVWRLPANMPAPAEQISSPYDPEARYSVKRESAWTGYKVHFTETCDPETPHLIVNVETTPATTPDDHMAAVVHASLERRALLPGEHLVDKGYTDARMLVDSARDYGITIVGPVADDPSWQARAGGGFDKSRFTVDWERQEVSCPAGKRSASWQPNRHPKNGVVVEAHFARADCLPCPLRPLCTRAKTGGRVVGLQAREHHEALQATRQAQASEAFRVSYAARAGIEGTHGQAVRRCGLRQCRYRGLAKVRLQHILTAIALNVIRVAAWVAGTPSATTRCSRFAALQAAT